MKPKRNRLVGLRIEEVSGVDHPANQAQVGGEGWLVLKADTTAAPLPQAAKEPTVPDTATAPTADQVELAKALARIDALEAQLAAATKPADQPDPLAKALESVPDVVREALAKAQESAANAERIAKAEADLRVNREYIAKAATLIDHLPADAGSVGPILRTVAEHGGEAQAAELDRLLKAASEQAKAAGLTAAVGTSRTTAVGGAWAAITKAAEPVAAEKGISIEAAIDLVTASRPELVAALRSEGGI